MKKQNAPPFCPEHQEKPVTYCRRPQTCKECISTHVDQATDPRPDSVKYCQDKSPKLIE